MDFIIRRSFAALRKSAGFPSAIICGKGSFVIWCFYCECPAWGLCVGTSIIGTQMTGINRFAIILRYKENLPHYFSRRFALIVSADLRGSFAALRKSAGFPSAIICGKGSFVIWCFYCECPAWGLSCGHKYYWNTDDTDWTDKISLTSCEAVESNTARLNILI